MAEASSSTLPAPPTPPPHVPADRITEDEASLYDRQIRLWGLEAQNRMRSSTVLILSLRSLAHETIKNLVLAGIGRLIVMDDGVVTEEDLGGGFLFHEEEGAVGQERTAAALPQIASLNPLVNLTAIPTLAPFVRDDTAGAQVEQVTEISDFLKREKVDVVVACDMSIQQLEIIDEGARDAGVLFYGAGTYGFYGYAFADLGNGYNYVTTPPSTKNNPTPTILKQSLSYPALRTIFDGSNWHLSHQHPAKGGSPYRDVTRNATKGLNPSLNIGIIALWEFEKKNGRLPEKEEDVAELSHSISRLRADLGVHAATYRDGPGKEAYDEVAEHLGLHAWHHFPPTLAILGGLLAQDVLRVLSRKGRPITNFLAVNTISGTGIAVRWAMAEAVTIQ